jgi:hypothetical protein
VLSTVGVGYGINGPTIPSLVDELEGIETIDRTSTNAFEDDAFRAAVEATGAQTLDHRGAAHRDLLRLRHSAGAEGRL